MPLIRSTWAPLIAILLAGFALRLVVAHWWQSQLPQDRLFLFPDSESYWHLARSIAEGRGYQFGGPDYKIFRTPGYPALLSLLFFAGGCSPSVFTARALSVLCGTAAIGAVFGLGRLLFNSRVGLLSAAIVAIYPGAIVLSIVVLSEAPFCPLMVLHLTLWALAWQAHSGWQMSLWSVAAGVVGALATLMRPSWLLFIPFAGVAGLFFNERSKHLRIGLLLLVGLVLGMLPWWIRNARVCGHFVPTTLQVGASLFDGLNPRANGGSNMWFTAEYDQTERQVESSEPLEYRLDRRLRRDALAWAAAHPGRVAELALRKLVRLWNLWPNEPQFRHWPLRLLVLASYAPLLFCGVLGAWRVRTAGFPYALCWLPGIYITLLHLIFVSSIRYREPIMLPLAVLASASILSARPKEV